MFYRVSLSSSRFADMVGHNDRGAAAFGAKGTVRTRCVAVCFDCRRSNHLCGLSKCVSKSVCVIEMLRFQIACQQQAPEAFFPTNDEHFYDFKDSAQRFMSHGKENTFALEF